MTHRQQSAPVFGKTIPFPQPLASSQGQLKARDVRAMLFSQMCELHARPIEASGRAITGEETLHPNTPNELEPCKSTRSAPILRLVKQNKTK